MLRFLTKTAAIKKSTFFKKVPINTILLRFLLETATISLFCIYLFFLRDILLRMGKITAINNYSSSVIISIVSLHIVKYLKGFSPLFGKQ